MQSAKKNPIDRKLPAAPRKDEGLQKNRGAYKRRKDVPQAFGPLSKGPGRLSAWSSSPNRLAIHTRVRQIGL